MKRLLLAVAILVAVSAVAQDSATVTLYREGRFHGSANGVQILSDNAPLAKVGNRSAVTVTLAAGRHALRAKSAANIPVLTVEPGKHYFVRVVLDTWRSGVTLLLVDEDQAREEMKAFRISEVSFDRASM